MKNTLKITGGVLVSFCIMLSSAILVFAKGAESVNEAAGMMAGSTVDPEMAILCAGIALIIGVTVFIKRHLVSSKSAA